MSVTIALDILVAIFTPNYALVKRDLFECSTDLLKALISYTQVP